MDFEDLIIKETDQPCNCPWTECGPHVGSLCSNNASAVERCPDPECRRMHYLGDETFGEGFHICKPCATFLGDIFMEQVPEFMTTFTKYVPKWMKPIEGMLKDAYKNGMLGEPCGWIMPQEDALAVLTFAYVCIVCDPKTITTGPGATSSVPSEILKKLYALTAIVKNMRKAFHQVSLPDKEVPQ